jgi:BTB/POZ domain
MTEPSIVEKLLNESTPAAKIRSSLVDVDLCADVTFTFASHDEDDAQNPIKAHKVFLISASPVFFTMFCGSLPPPTNDIAIDDICREDFIEVLRHIYGSDSVTINFVNVYGVWYAARKYLLNELTAKCVDFVCQRTNGCNVLNVFNSVQLFDNHKVDNVCLNLLLDCPHKYFEDKQIVKMNKDAFRKFIKMPEINCSLEFLKKIALKWLNFQKQTEYCCFSDNVQKIFAEEFEIPALCFTNKTLMPVLKINYLDNSCLKHMEKDWVMIQDITGMSMKLYGIGIYVGVDPDDRFLDSAEVIVVEVQREIFGSSRKKSICIRQDLTPSILQIMFKMIHLKNGSTITIKFSTNRRRAINPLSVGKKNLGKLFLSESQTCIAYLIEKNIKM